MSEQVAVLGAGVIGASWTALFLAAGKKVAVADPDPEVEEKVRAYVARAWPTLERLGLAANGDPEAVTFGSDPAKAVAGAAFIQENAPERLPIKRALYQEIEPALDAKAILASSASGLMPSELATGFGAFDRLVLGHPFNPPHLVPLVEVMGFPGTPDDAIAEAERFYQGVGKVTIRLNKEAPGHVANRLQAALWREAIHLVKEGVASVEDVDKAVWAGPGLRWAAMGPTQLFHLGAGEGGLASFVERYAESFHRWWDDLGDPRLDPATAKALIDGAEANAQGRSPEALSAFRDELLVAMLASSNAVRRDAN